MTRASLRFLHAGDFRLHLPAHGLSEIPAHLKDIFLEAPYQAARRVFDVAEREDVDFVILAGALYEHEAGGAYDAEFLAEQFHRLERRGIEVFWAADHAPAYRRAFDYGNVHLFSHDQIDRYIARRQGVAVASLVGAYGPRADAYRYLTNEADAGLFSVVVAPRAPERTATHGGPVDYVAFGGSHHAETLPGARPVAHCAGSPQGLSFREEGVHGVTLVEVDHRAPLRVRRIETDVLRFHNETINAGRERVLRDVEEEINRRIDTLRHGTFVGAHVVRWLVVGDSPAVRELLYGGDTELTRRLRQRHGQGTTSVWTAAVEALPTYGDAWREHVLAARESTIQEYLTRLGRFQAESVREEEWSAVADEATSREARRLVGSSSRQRVAAAAARLGVELIAHGGATS